MNYRETIIIIDEIIKQYGKGLFSIPETLRMIEKEIDIQTRFLYDTDKKIKTINKLYKHTFIAMNRAINSIERHG